VIRGRARIVLILALLPLLMAGAKLVQVNGRAAAAAALPERGTIRLADGSVAAANLERLDLYVRPSTLDPDLRAELTARGLEIPAAGSEMVLVWAGCDCAELLGARGVMLKRRTERVYPYGRSLAQIIGFVGRDGHGLEGVEYFFDARLAAGKEVKLTIDPVIQAAAERALADAVEQRRATTGSIVAIEVGTGRLLAVANAPGFDPASFASASPEAFRNRAFLDRIEPGSVAKPLVAATLLELGRLSPTELLAVEPAIQFGPKTIRDQNRRGDEIVEMDLAEILRVSSNVGIIALNQRLDSRELHSSLTSFGIGQKPDLPLPTARGELRSPETWFAFDHASAAIGQGFSVTALQLALAYSAIAADGVLVAPVLEADRRSPEQQRVMSVETSRIMRSLLYRVVDEGTGRLARVSGYSVAGKTGTAQVAENGRYSTEIFASLFAGFFPADRPRMAVTVIIQGSQRGIQGGDVAAPVFRAVAGETLAYWGLARDQVTTEAHR
jgi:cell division protein FtsI (penicillin-binding protein 3)